MQIIVYTRPNCSPCIATKRALQRRGLAFEERSADEPAAQALAAAHGYTAAPIVQAGSRSWSGFRPDRIEGIRPADAEPKQAQPENFDIVAKTSLIMGLWNYTKILIHKSTRC
ncbi:glutaredoxin domain-containing protein [Chelatococcus asaccharovorans]|uniref:Glutaredoxin n=1 Tax=Chelatococcus asaccharovorans TaxID=28210 RepID=A0A2V3TQY5_9HYPH|nr:glutaredoxin domain-containing protein [Chelatococcus asaccharovorans]MBS7708168.1 hypothetical protein [Chelatococcus asaccharovorans]PXW50108.1 glutaredoxin [Chelatococcus asaccharovorans]